MNKLYFWYSLIFLGARTTATILIGSTVQHNARRPFEVFRTIPSEGWNEELQRFFNQIKTETNAITGFEFFFVTKKLLFAMVGALLIYELVLLQFSTDDIDWDHLVDCKKAFSQF
jgi:gustatory receptor